MEGHLEPRQAVLFDWAGGFTFQAKLKLIYYVYRIQGIIHGLPTFLPRLLPSNHSQDYKLLHRVLSAQLQGFC